MVIFAPMEKGVIYLDNAASTPMDETVVDSMVQCMRTIYGNPSSLHNHGRKARVLIEHARRSIAGCLGVSSAEIFFTSGGTEAGNAVLWGCCKDLGFKNFITSTTEHPAILGTLDALVRHMGARVHFVKVDSLGNIDFEHLDTLLLQYPRSVVSLMHANNETGKLLPVKHVAGICKRYDAVFLSDTVQTIGKFRLDLRQLGLDFAMASAHKFHGPKGVGFMFIKSGHLLQSFLSGGAQERNMRAGTENVCGIVGMARALDVAMQRLDEDCVYIRGLKDEFVRLLSDRIPQIVFNGDINAGSLHTIVNFSLPQWKDPDMLLPGLDIEGICVSAGSACSSGSHKGSHVLEAMGVDPSVSSLRVSFSRYNTIEEIHRFVEVLSNLTCRTSDI